MYLRQNPVGAVCTCAPACAVVFPECTVSDIIALPRVLLEELLVLGLRDHLHIRAHLVVAQSAQFRTSDFVMIAQQRGRKMNPQIDRKSTRLNSSHLGISYAVFC